MSMRQKLAVLESNPARPGWATSEFYVTVAAGLGTILAAYSWNGHGAPTWMLGVVHLVGTLGPVIGGLIYTIMRTRVKQTAINNNYTPPLVPDSPLIPVLPSVPVLPSSPVPLLATPVGAPPDPPAPDRSHLQAPARKRTPAKKAPAKKATARKR